MDITCPNCKIKRTIADNLLPKNKKKISTLCKNCGHRFTLLLTPSAQGAEMPAAPGGGQRPPERPKTASPAPPPASPTKAPGKAPGKTPTKAPTGGERPAPTRRPAPAAEETPTRAPRAPKRSETRSLGIILSKGGVGKTTTSVNLSAGLALAGYKVLLVDTDTQGQSSYMLGCDPEYGLADLVTKDMEPQKAVFKARENLWLLAGGRSLAGVKRLIDRKDFGGELTLAEALAPIESLFDYVIVDSSPGWDPLTVNVLFYVRELLIPVSLEVMSLQGLSEFSKSLSTIQKYRKEVDISYILPTFLDTKVGSRTEILNRLKELYQDRICTPVRFDPNISEAPAYGQSIYEYSGDSIGAVDYKALVRKVTDGSALI